MKNTFTFFVILLTSIGARAESQSSVQSLVDRFVEEFQSEAASASENLRVYEKRIAFALHEIQSGKTLKTSPALALVIRKSRASVDLQSSPTTWVFTAPLSWAIDQIEQDLSAKTSLSAARSKLTRLGTILKSIRVRLHSRP